MSVQKPGYLGMFWLKLKAKLHSTLDPVEIHWLLGHEPYSNQLEFYRRGCWVPGARGGRTTALVISGLSRATSGQKTIMIVRSPKTIQVVIDDLAVTTGLVWCKALIKVLNERSPITPFSTERVLVHDR